LFTAIDTTGDGRITVEDFAHPVTKAVSQMALKQWQRVHAEAKRAVAAMAACSGGGGTGIGGAEPYVELWELQRYFLRVAEEHVQQSTSIQAALNVRVRAACRELASLLTLRVRLDDAEKLNKRQRTDAHDSSGAGAGAVKRHRVATASGAARADCAGADLSCAAVAAHSVVRAAASAAAGVDERLHALVQLDAPSRRSIAHLFSLLDKTGDGIIALDDFTGDGAVSAEMHRLFNDLKQLFGASGGGSIRQHEFLRFFLRQGVLFLQLDRECVDDINAAVYGTAATFYEAAARTLDAKRPVEEHTPRAAAAVLDEFDAVRGMFGALGISTQQASALEMFEYAVPTPNLSLPAHWQRTAAERSAAGFVCLPIIRGDGCDAATWRVLSGCLQPPNPKWLGHGRDHREPGDYDGLRLARAWRIENPIMWREYAAAQQRVSAELNRLSSGPVRYCAHASATTNHLRQHVGGVLEHRKDCNEAYLLHGTMPGVLPAIMSGGANERLSGANPSFGSGNYFSEDASKSDQYATNDAVHGLFPELHGHIYADGMPRHPGRPTYYVLLCRVLLGAVVRTCDGITRLDGDGPCFATDRKSELATVPGSSPAVNYHSLLVERTDGKMPEHVPGQVQPTAVFRHREHVVFRGSFIYPEYLLAYHRTDRGEMWDKDAAGLALCNTMSQLEAFAVQTRPDDTAQQEEALHLACSLGPAARRAVHLRAEKLRLGHESVGEGAERHIVITRRPL
jgi:Ca2+-binding EF-hand superfamily protein